MLQLVVVVLVVIVVVVVVVVVVRHDTMFETFRSFLCPRFLGSRPLSPGLLGPYGLGP